LCDEKNVEVIRLKKGEVMIEVLDVLEVIEELTEVLE